MAIIEAYIVWASKIMSLSHFRHIRSEYYPKFEESSVGDKCHQLRFTIHFINQASTGNFI